MPCPKCGHILLFLDHDELCPKCEGLAVLDSETSIKVATRLVALSSKIFDDELQKWERDTLLGNLAAKRELFSREFFKRHSVLNVGKLTELTLLIKRVTEFGSYRGKTPLQASEIDVLIDTFESLNKFESILLNVRAGFNNILCQKKFNEDSFTLSDATETFYVVQNERWVNKKKHLLVIMFTQREKPNKNSLNLTKMSQTTKKNPSTSYYYRRNLSTNIMNF